MIEIKYYSDIPKNFTGVCKVADTGSIYHMKNGKYHNENGPAIIYENGTKRWYINNMLHREDGAAIEYPNGSKSWYYKNKYYESNGFTTWKEKVEELKYLESLEIFL